MLIEKDEIERAYERVRKYLSPTPVIRSPYYSSKTGCDIFLKLENLQPTHSFKVRGALNAILSAPEEKRKQGIICASGGNHGLGVALVSSWLKLPCQVFLPTKTPQLKIDNIKRLGASVILHGDAWDDANKLAQSTAQKDDCAYIHPFDDPYVMAGQATIFLELLEQVRDLDSVIVSIGGGGLISGIVSAVKHFSPNTKVIGVETNGANCMSLSVNAGRIEELPAITSIADSLGARKTEPRQFDIISKHVDELIVVDDNEAIASLLELLNEEKLLVEPATSCSLAALTSGRIKTNLGKQLAVIMCGGNIALERVCQWADASKENLVHR